MRAGSQSPIGSSFEEKVDNKRGGEGKIERESKRGAGKKHSSPGLS